ncbi:MAG TPA: hypothetical protein VI230_06540 [Ignavibacteriaceae bacterium]
MAGNALLENGSKAEQDGFRTHSRRIQNAFRWSLNDMREYIQQD